MRTLEVSWRKNGVQDCYLRRKKQRSSGKVGKKYGWLMKITTYNIRGLGGGVKWSSVHRIVVKDQEDLWCIQETKRDRVDKWACQALWEDSEICWAESPAINNAGGMLCLWTESTFSVERKIIGTGYVVLEGVWRCDGERITIANIYSPCDVVLKRNLWEEVKQIKEGWKYEDVCRLPAAEQSHYQEQISSIEDRWFDWSIEGSDGIFEDRFAIGVSSNPS